MFDLTAEFHRPIRLYVCDGMWLMWLDPGIEAPSRSAHASAFPGSSVASVAWM